MKLSEFIRQLRAECPEGEDPEVTIGKCDIWFVDRTAEFYDGPTQIFTKRDKNGQPLAGEYRNGMGLILNIWYKPFSDCLEGDPDFPINYSALSERDQKATKEWHNQIREEERQFQIRINRGRFITWVKEKFAVQDKLFLDYAEDFYDKHLKGTDSKWSWDDKVILENGELKLNERRD